MGRRGRHCRFRLARLVRLIQVCVRMEIWLRYDQRRWFASPWHAADRRWPRPATRRLVSSPPRLEEPPSFEPTRHDTTVAASFGDNHVSATFRARKSPTRAPVRSSRVMPNANNATHATKPGTGPHTSARGRCLAGNHQAIEAKRRMRSQTSEVRAGRTHL